MKQSLLCHVIWIALLICLCHVSALSKVMAVSFVVDDPPDGVLASVRGEVRVRRRGWRQYEPATQGAPLNRGDLLQVENGSEAIILCADGSRKPIPSGFSGVPCSISRAQSPSFFQTLLSSIFQGITSVGPTRGEIPDDVPVIIAPRRTKISDAHPTLRWTALAGASGPVVYVVSLKARGREIWRTEISGTTELIYPDQNAPALKAGETYRLVVAVKDCVPTLPNSCNSDKETLPGRGFSLLKAEEIKRVKDAEAALRSLGIEEHLTQLLIAKYYISQGLFSEATDQLEKLSKILTVPAIEQALGDSYFAIGLGRLAEKHYLVALDLAQAAHDTEGQAIAQSSLGMVYGEIGNIPAAKLKFQKALELYTSLGDTATISELQKRISGLQEK